MNSIFSVEKCFGFADIVGACFCVKAFTLQLLLTAAVAAGVSARLSDTTGLREYFPVALIKDERAQGNESLNKFVIYASVY